jgi:hypothetical protein
MKTAHSFIEAFQPWAGLVVGVLAAGIVHQFGSEALFNNCRVIPPVTVLLVALAGLALCGVSGLVSWRSARSDLGARRVVGIISVGSSALFALAIVLPLIAALMIPQCFQ